MAGRVWQHVIPLFDLRLHHLSDDCWCRPTVDDADDLVTHHAADQRERTELRGRCDG
jgi:hypothetical protein